MMGIKIAIGMNRWAVVAARMRADVVFALRGISPELCVEEAMRGMLRRKTIIVPSALMRAATTAQRFMPMALLMPIMAHQQKKKLG